MDKMNYFEPSETCQKSNGLVKLTDPSYYGNSSVCVCNSSDANRLFYAIGSFEPIAISNI